MFLFFSYFVPSLLVLAEAKNHHQTWFWYNEDSVQSMPRTGKDFGFAM
jgi:hypothetical protein